MKVSCDVRFYISDCPPDEEAEGQEATVEPEPGSEPRQALTCRRYSVLLGRGLTPSKIQASCVAP